VIDEDAEVGYWHARAGRAEARVAELEAATAALRAENAGLTARMAELQESVTTLSGLLFGSSSEKGGSPSRGDGRDGAGGGDGGVRPGGRKQRGQRPGRPGHGRRDRSQLETEERIIDVEAGQRCCAQCGEPFEFLGTEDSEQIDWQVKITRIVWRRRRYRRRCSHPGPRTACAPPAARPVPKGLFTAGFLARLAYEKHVLGRPVHRIVAALAADGLDVAPGTLCGALKQVAPLIAPWAAAIAAHGRAAGHVHADETSWQVFEDIAGKDGHRWWLWTFVTSETTVFVMDTSRSAGVAAGQLGIDRDQAALQGGRRLVISSDFHKAYQSLARIDGVDPLWCFAHMRRYFLRGRAAHPEALGEWADAWTERIAVLYRAHHALAATTPGTDARQDAADRWQRAFADIGAHRTLQASDAAKGLLHPAAAKVIATLDNEWDGLARHRDLPQLPLDNNPAEQAAHPGDRPQELLRLRRRMGRPPGRRRLDRHRHRRPPRHRAPRPADRLPARMRPQRRNRPGRSRPGPLPALDTPGTRPPPPRQRSRPRPVTPAIPSLAKPAHASPPDAAEGNSAMPSPTP